jgi:cytochrome P450
MKTEPISVTFSDSATQRCPFEAYDKIREVAPVYKDPITGNYVLTRFEDVRKALLNVKALRNRTGLIHVRENPVTDQMYKERGWLPLNTLVNNDPPEHGIYRALVDKVFTPKRVAAIEPRIAEIVEDLIDAFIDQKEIEFLDAFAIKLPMYMISEQLGVPREDIARFKMWSDVAVEMISQSIAPEREIEITGHIIDMQNYFAKVVEKVRITPNDTLISQLTNTDIEGRRLDMRELSGILQQLLIGGNDTSTSTIASGMKLLIEQPELAERLHAQPELAKQFAEETLRTRSAVQVLFRKVAEDIEIQGVPIPAGSIVEVRYGAANRDPTQFTDPAKVNLDRSNAQTHLAFGAGRHFCIGNQLARAELTLAFQALTRRLTNFRASRGENSYRPITSYIGHGVNLLWMSFDKR